jgi:hypothetical protein
MLGGGVGEWLHEGALGLRVRHRPAAAAAAAAAATPLTAEHAACARRLGLQLDVVAVHGVQPARLCVLAAASEAARAALPWAEGGRGDGVASRAGHPLHLAAVQARLREAATAAGLPPAEPVAPVWGPRVQLTLEAPLLRGLRSARGHVSTPYGTASAAWRYSPGSRARLSVALSVPHPAPAVVDLPLRALLPARVAAGEDGAAGTPWRLSVLREAEAPGETHLACAPVDGLGAASPGVAVELCGAPAPGGTLPAASWRSRLAVHDRLALAAPGGECGGGACDEFLSLRLPHGSWRLQLELRRGGAPSL